MAESRFGIRGIKGLCWDGIEKYNLALPWLAEHNLNFLMLCYTSFPASASDWRADYTPTLRQQIGKLTERGRKLGVDVCLAFNPGIASKPPLTYSSETDYQSALGKVKSIHSLGINWFALCLDDIGKELQPADKEEFGTLQDAQVHFVNRLWRDMKKLKPAPKLIFCPSAYLTAEAETHLDYITTVGNEIDRGVMMFWTGPQCCSSSITAAAARKFGAWIRRKPFVWDNFPVNDMCGWRPIVSPLRNRSADLPEAVSGYIANPMRQWEASKIPLSTTAAYLNDPAGYDPDRAMEATIRKFPPDQQRAVRLLVKLYGAKFWGDPGFPQRVDPKDREEAERLLPSYRALRKELSGDPALRLLWEDCEEGIRRDIDILERKTQDRRLTSPLKALGGDFEGGAGSVFGHQFYGREVNYVYAKPTGHDAMRAEFWIDAPSPNGAKLRLTARNDDSVRKSRVRIALNDHALVDGESHFSGSGFEAVTFDLPTGVLKSGSNVLTITNLEPDGALGMPPWFMVAEAEIVIL